MARTEAASSDNRKWRGGNRMKRRPHGPALRTACKSRLRVIVQSAALVLAVLMVQCSILDILPWQRFELIAIHEQGRTLAGKKNVEEVARVEDSVDRASAACVQPMHALIRANALACFE